MEELATLRRDLLRDLPMDIRRARRAYRRVAQEAALIMDAKSFSIHQSACKAGLAHLESLIKMLRWACEGQGTSGEDSRGVGEKASVGGDGGIEKLISEARIALGKG